MRKKGCGVREALPPPFFRFFSPFPWDGGWGLGRTGKILLDFEKAPYCLITKYCAEGLLGKYLNPNHRFLPAFWLLQFRNLCKEQ